MNEANTKKLIAIYPQLFGNQSLFPFECGDGWFDLLADCIAELKEIGGKITYTYDDAEYEVEQLAHQVKEKYGTLRFYLSWSGDAVDEIIGKYENLSAITCEMCGKRGKLIQETGWWMVRCEECLQKNS